MNRPNAALSPAATLGAPQPYVTMKRRRRASRPHAVKAVDSWHSDRFADIRADIADAILDLDKGDDARLNAIVGIRCALWASDLTLDDLAARVFWGAETPRGTRH